MSELNTYRELAHAAREQMTEAELVSRAREYLSEKVLDLADVPKFIELLVKVWDEYHVLQVHCLDKGFDLSDV